MELTTVADDFAVVHDDFDVRTYDGLVPDQLYEYDGFTFRTLPRPDGELLCTFATVNDVHFGETDCGIIEGLDMGPIFTVQEGEEPYPETMNRAAIQEMQHGDFAAIVVKGDLTSKGTFEEYNQFLEYYERAFGERLVHIRGNHDAYYGNTFADDAPCAVELPGVTLAIIDTSIPAACVGSSHGGHVDVAARHCVQSDQPILVFGHHHVWSPESVSRPDSLLRHQPRRLGALGGRCCCRAEHHRLFRRPHAPQPGAQVRHHA